MGRLILMTMTNTAASLEGWEPACNIGNYAPYCHDFSWSADGTMFKAHKLLWWDDASYIAYQSDCGDGWQPEDGDDVPTGEVVLEPCDMGPHREDDGLPF